MRGIFFDMDGVLLDSMPHHAEAMYQALKLEIDYDLDMNFSNDNNTTIVTQIQEKVMGYDDFIVENINLTKWRVDDQSTESFIFASGEHAHTGVVTTNEMVYVPYNNLHIIIKFTALYTEFDSPEIQELEKRLIDSIDLL